MCVCEIWVCVCESCVSVSCASVVFEYGCLLYVFMCGFVCLLRASLFVCCACLCRPACTRSYVYRFVCMFVLLCATVSACIHVHSFVFVCVCVCMCVYVCASLMVGLYTSWLPFLATVVLAIDASLIAEICFAVPPMSSLTVVHFPVSLSEHSITSGYLHRVHEKVHFEQFSIPSSFSQISLEPCIH